jgi:hypothetical protein
MSAKYSFHRQSRTEGVDQGNLQAAKPKKRSTDPNRSPGLMPLLNFDAWALAFQGGLTEAIWTRLRYW